MTVYEHEARERKALKIALHIWRCTLEGLERTPTTRELAALIVELAATPQPVRDAFAQGAGAKSPSNKTWGRVIEIIGRKGLTWAAVIMRAASAQQVRLDEVRREINDDPFAGITEADAEAPERAKERARGIV